MNNIPKKVTKQILEEPFELLETAKRQMSGSEFYPPPEKPITQKEDGPSEEQKALEKKVNQTDTRQLQALESEMRDIRRQGVFDELVQKILRGEEVPLTDYPDLAIEQKQVLKAQMEAVKLRQAQIAQGQKPLKEPSLRRSRRFPFGRRQKAESLKTHVERPILLPG